MELRVKHANGEWYPLDHDTESYDAIIEVPDHVAARYLQLADEVIAMSDSIEAQVHGTS